MLRWKNRYKIDVNEYSSDTYPFALYVKRTNLTARWKHLASFKTADEAKQLHQQVEDLPIYLKALFNRRNHP